MIDDITDIMIDNWLIDNWQNREKNTPCHQSLLSTFRILCVCAKSFYQGLLLHTISLQLQPFKKIIVHLLVVCAGVHMRDVAYIGVSGTHPREPLLTTVWVPGINWGLNASAITWWVTLSPCHLVFWKQDLVLYHGMALNSWSSCLSLVCCAQLFWDFP